MYDLKPVLMFLCLISGFHSRGGFMGKRYIFSHPENISRKLPVVGFSEIPHCSGVWKIMWTEKLDWCIFLNVFHFMINFWLIPQQQTDVESSEFKTTAFRHQAMLWRVLNMPNEYQYMPSDRTPYLCSHFLKSIWLRHISVLENPHVSAMYENSFSEDKHLRTYKAHPYSAQLTLATARTLTASFSS